MAFPLVLIPLIMSAIQMGASGVKAAKAKQKQNQLWANRPQLGVTEAEKANDALFKQMATATEMPGQRQFEAKLGQTYAEGVSDIQKTAPSSLMATQGAINLSEKKMQAVQDLAGMFAEFKAKRQMDLAAWNTQKIDLNAQRFNVNEWMPWNIRMNEAAGGMKAGQQGFWNGFDTAGAGLTNYFNMQNMGKGYASMMPKMDDVQSTYSPQNNLSKTLSEMTNNINVNHPPLVDTSRYSSDAHINNVFDWNQFNPVWNSPKV